MFICSPLHGFHSDRPHLQPRPSSAKLMLMGGANLLGGAPPLNSPIDLAVIYFLQAKNVPKL